MPATVSIRDLGEGLNTPTANGVSWNARRLERFGYGRRTARRDTSITIGDRAVEGLVRLLDVCNQASNDDTTEPIDLHGYHLAEAFLTALPAHIPLPEVLVHPDGEIAFEWHRDPRRVVTVSVSADGTLPFAGLFGDSTTYGRERFSGTVPDAIAHCLDRLFAPQVVMRRR
jgi:hypothetical protein